MWTRDRKHRRRHQKLALQDGDEAVLEAQQLQGVVLMPEPSQVREQL